MSVRLLVGDCLERMRELPDASVDSVVCDPPYHLTSIVKRFGSANAAPAKGNDAFVRASRGFMGQQWDGGDVAFRAETWAEVLRVLKPGGHLVAFSGCRTYHRMACAIEDAGFEIRDMLSWIFGNGFPKSHDVSKGIDRLNGDERPVLGSRKVVPGVAFQSTGPSELAITSAASAAWEGWGTALKPAHEPICLARKPLIGTIAANVLAHGTGALNIDRCRVEAAIGDEPVKWETPRGGIWKTDAQAQAQAQVLGRWPANALHDGSDEVLQHFPEAPGQIVSPSSAPRKTGNVYGKVSGPRGDVAPRDHGGSAARFFYSAKADPTERHAGCEEFAKGNHHPTVKPIDLMRWLCRLVTPKGGTVLDPFCGSGSTLIAADAEQLHAIGCELSPDYAAIAERRLKAAAGMFLELEVAA